MTEVEPHTPELQMIAAAQGFLVAGTPAAMADGSRMLDEALRAIQTGRCTAGTSPESSKAWAAMILRHLSSIRLLAASAAGRYRTTLESHGAAYDGAGAVTSPWVSRRPLTEA